jgi:hypothetical protein
MYFYFDSIVFLGILQSIVKPKYNSDYEHVTFKTGLLYCASLLL